MKGGNVPIKDTPKRELQGFNEAALHEGRKWRKHPSTQRAALSFNEAALHEGRKSSRPGDGKSAFLASMRPPFMKGGNQRAFKTFGNCKWLQ